MATNSENFKKIHFKKFPPVSKFVISAAPSGNFTIPCAISVITGAKLVAINKATAITTVNEITECKIFPLRLGTTNAAKNGIVAKSPKGSTRFPGRITAKNNVIGTIKRPVDSAAGEPVAKAASIPR